MSPEHLQPIPSLAVILDYDPRWPGLFAALCEPIVSALGDLAARIEHIGSTAVPGLAAKPIIDFDVLLRSASDLPTVIARLSSLRYVHQGDLGIPGREAFQNPPGTFPHHLYVCLPDCAQFQRHLKFRDHLRTHPLDARTYASLKRQLAAQFTNDRDAYTSGKTEFINSILNP
jgi:GrpB-like predicted nucleotidyltransferase (UPF0157 family)